MEDDEENSVSAAVAKERPKATLAELLLASLL
jgi:hypothetical protein